MRIRFSEGTVNAAIKFRALKTFVEGHQSKKAI